MWRFKYVWKLLPVRQFMLLLMLGHIDEEFAKFFYDLRKVSYLFAILYDRFDAIFLIYSPTYNFIYGAPGLPDICPTFFKLPIVVDIFSFTYSLFEYLVVNTQSIFKFSIW